MRYLTYVSSKVAPLLVNYEEKTMEVFYMDIMKAKERYKHRDITSVISDLKAKGGRGRVHNVVGPFELGMRND